MAVCRAARASSLSLRAAPSFSEARVRKPSLLAASACAARARKVSPSFSSALSSSAFCSSRERRNSTFWVSATARACRVSPRSCASPCARSSATPSERRNSSTVACAALAAPSASRSLSSVPHRRASRSPSFASPRARSRAADHSHPTATPSADATTATRMISAPDMEGRLSECSGSRQVGPPDEGSPATQGQYVSPNPYG